MIRRMVFAACCLVMAASPALAQRVDSRSLSCAAAQDLVRQRGSVVLSTSTFLFYRYVSDRSYCDRSQVLRAAAAPTSDNPNCNVGFRCAGRPNSSN